LEDRHNFEGKVDVLADPVSHELKHAVRWDESDGAVPVEAAQADALVELDVVDLYAAVLLGRVRIFNKELVIDAEFALGHPRQLGLHQDLSEDISLEYSATD
jgi:hypothetical protein